MIWHRRSGRCTAYRLSEFRCDGCWKTYLTFGDSPFELRYAKTYVCGFGLADRRSHCCNDGVHAEWRATGEPCDRCDEIARLYSLCRREMGGSDGGMRRMMRPRGASRLVNIIVERPNRQRLRQAMRDAAAEWNAFGETDVDPDPPVTRGADWLWW